MGADYDKLFDRVLESTVRSARTTLDLRARVQSTPFEGVAERLESFRANAGPVVESDDIPGGFHVRSADAKAFLTTLEMHPAFTSGSRLDVGIQVIGPDGIENTKLREDAAELLLLGGLALSQEGANEKH